MRKRLRRSRTSDPLMLFISWLVQSTITIESFTHQSSYPWISPSTRVRVHAYKFLPVHLSVPSSITNTKHTSTQARKHKSKQEEVHKHTSTQAHKHTSTNSTHF
jgi:hypothetical protein